MLLYCFYKYHILNAVLILAKIFHQEVKQKIATFQNYKEHFDGMQII